MSGTVIGRRVDGDCAVVSLSGEFDLSNSDQLRAALLAELDHGEGRHLVLDLGEVSFLDSTALGVLVAARNLAMQHDLRVAVAQPSERIMRLLEITQLEDVFAIYDDVETAVEKLGA